MADSTEPSPAPGRRRINLALQGGGSHGAFTWGVLDALLEDGRLEIDAVTGTSAGALNAAALACGLASGGADGARAMLAELWGRVGALGRVSPFQRSWASRLTGRWRIDDSPGFNLFNLLGLWLSPAQSNPYGLNPLRGILGDVLDMEAIRKGPVTLFVAATDIETGNIRLFSNPDMCVEALLASACLPHLFPPVEYQGRHYWDGGYLGNPALWPLFYRTATRDVLLVQVTPLRRPGLPASPHELVDRVSEIAFNSSLIREMRAVAFVTRLIDEGRLSGDEYRRVLMHRVEAGDGFAALHASTKLNAEPDFLRHLFDLGRAAATDWLATDFDGVGVRSTIDIRADYLT